MRLIAAARARRRSLCGRSSTCWSFVYAWMVVMKPRSIPKLSSSTFAIGATQFVVHDALEMIECCSGSYASSLTPSTRVTSGSVAGAEMITFFAPASRCFCAAAPVGEEAGRLDHHVDAEVAPRQIRRIALGEALQLLAVDRRASHPSTCDVTVEAVPSTESWLAAGAPSSRTSPRSLNATISKSPPRSSAARKKLRPIRPNPLIPTRVFAMTATLTRASRLAAMP